MHHQKASFKSCFIALALFGCSANVETDDEMLTSVHQSLGDSNASSNEYLFRGQRIVSPDCGLRLDMQNDGNLVLYDQSRFSGDRALWSVGVNSTSWVAAMQSDGNLVTYTKFWTAHWSSHTAGNPNSYLKIQNDGNAVIYSPNGAALWSTGTAGPNRSRVPCPNSSNTTHIDFAYDRPGGDYIHFDMTSEYFLQYGDYTLGCAYACFSASRCRAFTVDKRPLTPVCWLKDSLPGRVTSPTSIDSGYLER